MLALVDSVGRFVDLFGGLEKVAQIIGVISAVFLGGKLLSGIGSVVIAVWRAVAAFTALDLAALAIPIAIGAIAVAVALLVEDIVTFFQGGESYFGKFLANFPVLGKAILGVFSLIKNAVMDVVNAYAIMFGWIVKIATAVGQLLAPVLSAVGKGISWLGSKVGSSLGQFDTTGAYDILARNNSPTSSPTTSTSNVQAPVRVDSNMTFNVGPNVDPTQVAPKLQGSIDDGFASLIRRASSSYLGEGSPVY